MTGLIVIVAAILIINVIRLCLAIQQSKKIDLINEMASAHQARWNQTCEDALKWVQEECDGSEADTEAENISK